MKQTAFYLYFSIPACFTLPPGDGSYIHFCLSWSIGGISETAQWLGALLLFQSISIWFSESTWWLTITCKSKRPNGHSGLHGHCMRMVHGHASHTKHAYPQRLIKFSFWKDLNYLIQPRSGAHLCLHQMQVKRIKILCTKVAAWAGDSKT